MLNWAPMKHCVLPRMYVPGPLLFEHKASSHLLCGKVNVRHNTSPGAKTFKHWLPSCALSWKSAPAALASFKWHLSTSCAQSL